MELLRGLGALAETAGPDTDRLADALGLEALGPADHTELFTLQLPPYASIYLGEQGMLGGEARDRIAGFWRVAGSTPPAEPDHLAALLATYASLVEGETAAVETDPWRRLRHAFFWEHVASWLFPYLARAEEVAPQAYRPWVELLAMTLSQEARRLDAPSQLPAHLREASPAAEEDEGEALLGALLAPARSGIILTRRDLAGAAETLGLGLRLGERRYIMENFFNQDPLATAGWLAEEARRQAALFDAVESESEGVRRVLAHWSARARETAQRLTMPTTPTFTLQEATHA